MGVWQPGQLPDGGTKVWGQPALGAALGAALPGGGLPVRRFKAPAWLPGVDFSDHLNYWRFGYPALLLTDTAFYRNLAYHQATDTLARLDLRRLALAVDALAATLAD